MILDRSIAPPSQIINHINILKAEKTLLDNQIPLYSIRAGEQSVIRLELIFDAGSRHETTNGASFFTSKMLTEGTSTHNSTQISEYFDQFGAFLEITQTADRFSMMVYGLTQHLPKFLPMLQEMISDSVFPEKELEMQKTIASQNLKVNLEKTAFVAGQVFREQLFGKNHPYGRSQTLEKIKKTTRQEVKDFYENQIRDNSFKIFLSGKFGDKEIALVNDFFGKNKIQTTDNQIIRNELNLIKSENILIEKAKNLQSSIRFGKVLFNRKNPDFFKFMVTNTIFGGYFGSRLMKNIREDKGFTYGISSSLVPMSESGYLIMGTDVKKENTQETLDEIRKEIIKIQTEIVDENELETAKNYMIGSFVGSLNTPFEIADRQKVVILDNLPIDFYENYIQNIRKISAKDVITMANKYYDLNEMCEVVVGGK